MNEPSVWFDRLPVDAPITGGFGQQYGSGGSTWLHRGVDFGCPTGTAVVAPCAGTVVQPFNDGSFGVAVCLDHGDGWYSIYAHLSRRDVTDGQRVTPGQQLGLSGATGFVTGPHLHWQLSDSPTFPGDISRSRDPLRYLRKEVPMTKSERALINIASGDFNHAFEIYRALRALGMLPEEGIEVALGNGDQADDLNAALVMRFRLIALATSDAADAAYRAIGGQP